ncbi:MAG: DUF1819 family protein [Candidatus Sericytochromatia bacterium]|nr:DUF1819 family protein [Candidatus Sericytochromatia bacterium]
MSQTKYSLSFTTGSLFLQESLLIAGLYLDNFDWAQVRQVVVKDNLLQARTQNTSERVCSEVISRLKHLTRAQLELLSQGSRHDQYYLLWLAICRRYAFIGDFAQEMLREKFLRFVSELTYLDFDIFFHRKQEWHEELNQIKPITRQKLRQTLFKMMREADLINAKSLIQPVLLSGALLQVIQADRLEDLRFFPIFDTDLQFGLQAV